MSSKLTKSDMDSSRVPGGRTRFSQGPSADGNATTTGHNNLAIINGSGLSNEECIPRLMLSHVEGASCSSTQGPSTEVSGIAFLTLYNVFYVLHRLEMSVSASFIIQLLKESAFSQTATTITVTQCQ